jgi:2-C-methyl-D-erythritol 4-phosphate cytidylyltransferase
MAADAIIVSGGSGTRFGSKKQFISIGGVPLIRRAADCFDAHLGVERIIVAVPADDLGLTAGILSGLGKPLVLTAGGKTRQESVSNALKHCRRSGLVLIHDGVRPFATLALISRVLEGITGFDACIPGLAVSNTLKEVDGKIVKRTVPRKGLFAVQTPQCFQAEVILEAHARAAGRGFMEATDDSALVEEQGGRVRLVEGDPFNIKITLAQDVEIAEALLRCRSESD